MKHTDCKTLLILAFENAKQRNASYSMCAMARDLGVSYTYMFRVIKGERSASPDLAYKLARYLRFSNDDTLGLIVSTFKNDEARSVEESYKENLIN